MVNYGICGISVDTFASIWFHILFAELDRFLCKPLDFRSRDWGSAPRWVAFVDFFIAAEARYTVVTGAHRRVGTTYAQLIASLAAANRHGTYGLSLNMSLLYLVMS